MGRSPGTVPARQVLPVAAVDYIFYQCINISLIFILDAISLNSGHFSNCYITTAKRALEVELSLVNAIFLLTHHRP